MERMGGQADMKKLLEQLQCLQVTSPSGGGGARKGVSSEDAEAPSNAFDELRDATTKLVRMVGPASPSMGANGGELPSSSGDGEDESSEFMREEAIKEKMRSLASAT